MEVPSQAEPLISDFPAVSEDREFQPDLFQQNIIDGDIQARNKEASDVAHRYNCWSLYDSYGADDFVDSQGDDSYGTEALASVTKEVTHLHDKRVWTPIKYDSIVNKAKIK